MLDNARIGRLPFTLSFPLTRHLESLRRGEYNRSFNYLMDFFEMSLIWLTLYLAKRLIDRGCADETLRRAVETIDGKRPLSLGDWLNSLFIPILTSSCKELEGDRLVESLHSNLMRRKACVLNGTKLTPGVVAVRNEYKGHGTTLADGIYKELIDSLAPQLEALAEGVAPLAECTAVSFDGERFAIHNGTSCSSVEACDDRVARIDNPEKGHYYVAFDGLTTDLFPLVMADGNGYVYIFHTLREDHITYKSVNENARSLTTRTYNEAFDRLLQRVEPSFDISRELNWLQIRELVNRESKKILDRAYREKKYNHELFVERGHLTESLKAFVADGEKILFPMLGEAGQGKTNQLCHWTETYINQGEAVLYLQGSDFSGITLGEYLKSVLGVSKRKDITKVVDNINAQAVKAGRLLYVLVDAVNECLFYSGTPDLPGPVALYRDIAEIFGARGAGRVKILFTCRNFTWKNLLLKESEPQRGLIFSPDGAETFEVKGFDGGELETAYAVYRELYQMETAFQGLAHPARIRLKDPLVLKIACTNFLGSFMPDDTGSYTTIRLFEKMYDDIRRSYAGKRQIKILEALGEYFLDKYEHGIPADSISQKELRDAYTDPRSPLHVLSRLVYKNEGISVAFAELLNKSERPVLRIVDNEISGESRIQFIYERFLEFILGRVYVANHPAPTPGRARIDASAYAATLSCAACNEVFMGAMRNAMIMDLMASGDFSPLVDLVLRHGDMPEAGLLVNDVCRVLIGENFENLVFSLLDCLLAYRIEDEDAVVEQFDKVAAQVEANRADMSTLAEYKRLQDTLLPSVKLRKLAVVNTVNGVLLTDYCHHHLYSRDPFDYLWRLMDDNIREIGNDACMYVYYLSNRTHTAHNTKFAVPLTHTVLERMYGIICGQSLVRGMSFPRSRKRLLGMTETAVRLSFLLIVDLFLGGGEDRQEKVSLLFRDIRRVFDHFTFKGRLVKLAMPFIGMALRRQITFQKEYVNNAVEYQGYWQEDVVPRYGADGKWSREHMERLLPLITYSTDSPAEKSDKEYLFAELETALRNAYLKGDSFSFFVLERIMVIVGVYRWEWLKPVMESLLSEEYLDGAEWPDYSQMSLLYSLYQIGILAPGTDRELEDLFGRKAEDWTLRCRGLFKARNSHKANSTGMYKRNLMSWYTAVCMSNREETKGRVEEEVPVFYRLIRKAIDEKDSELLGHLVDNIEEVVTDMGYVDTALRLLLYIMRRLDSRGKTAPFETEEGPGIVARIGRVLSTAKNYYPAKVDAFIKQDLADLPFPGVAVYKEDILAYNPGGETLSDLLTHKFGNFVMRSLIHEPDFSHFARRVIRETIDQKDCFSWYDSAMKIVLNTLFDVKFRGL